MQIKVFIRSISAERFWEPGEPFPPIHVATNLHIVSMEKRESKIIVPFILNVTYTPAVGNITLKGKAIVTGEEEELNKLIAAYRRKSPPDARIMQTISNVSFIESTLISRIINVPPPIPLPQISQKEEQNNKRARYTA